MQPRVPSRLPTEDCCRQYNSDSIVDRAVSGCSSLASAMAAEISPMKAKWPEDDAHEDGAH